MIYVSNTAAAELKRRLSLQSDSHEVIRLSLAPGGCADWHYTLETASKPHANETQFNFDSFQITLNQKLVDILDGLTIDYSEDLMGGSFRFINPKASETCGCSNSFTLENHKQLPDF